MYSLTIGKININDSPFHLQFGVSVVLLFFFFTYNYFFLSIKPTYI